MKTGSGALSSSVESNKAPSEIVKFTSADDASSICVSVSEVEVLVSFLMNICKLASEVPLTVSVDAGCDNKLVDGIVER